MGGHDKRGRWRVAPRCTVVNIMGGSDIDLNDAELPGPLTQLTMYSIMGGSGVARGRKQSREERRRERELRKAQRRGLGP
jgi:hypothetical protein